MTLRLAVVGDIHGSWTDADVRWFDQAGYDLVVVVGDLGGWRWSGTLAVAQGVGRLTCPTLVFPGNHDATHAVTLVNEAIAGFSRVSGAFVSTHLARRQELIEAIAPHPLGGYTSHPLGELTVVTGRPHSMGGPTLSFTATLQEAHGVSSLAASAERMKTLIEAAETERIVFVSHNGPAGLGANRDSIFGADFKPGAGDWGDPDLTTAIEHARRCGKRVVAVLAGHMHRRLRGGGDRPWQVRDQETLVVNAAVVPRIRDGEHHHVEVVIDGDTVTAEDRWVRV